MQQNTYNPLDLETKIPSINVSTLNNTSIKKKKKKNKTKKKKHHTHDDFYAKAMRTTFKGERMRGQVAQIYALDNTFKCTTFLKHMFYEIFSTLSLPIQLYYEGWGFTSLMGAFGCGTCVSSWKYSKKCPPIQYMFSHLSDILAIPIIIFGFFLNNPFKYTTDAGHALTAALLWYLFVYLLRVTAISIKYSTQTKRALKALRHRPKQNVQLWSSWLMNYYPKLSAGQLFERMQILQTLQGVPTATRRNLTFIMVFDTHELAQKHVEALIVFLFPPTIPKLKSNIINCLSSHEGYLSTIDITSINPDSKQSNPGNPSNKKYQIKIPAILVGIALTMQENVVGSNTYKIMDTLIKVCTFFCTILPVVFMCLLSSPTILLNNSDIQSDTNCENLQCHGIAEGTHKNNTQSLWKESCRGYPESNWIIPLGLIQYYYCISWEHQHRIYQTIIFLVAIIFSIPLTYIDLNYIKNGAIAFLKQYNILRHLDSAIAPGTRVVVVEENNGESGGGCKSENIESNNGSNNGGKVVQCLKSGLAFHQSLPLLQMSSMHNIETYLTLRHVLRNLYSNIFIRAQVLMVAYTIVCGIMVLILFLELNNPATDTTQVNFIVLLFSILVTGIILLLAFIYAQSKANLQVDVASRALLLARTNLPQVNLNEKFNKSTKEEQQQKENSIQSMLDALITGREILLEDARKNPFKIFGMKADKNLLSSIAAIFGAVISSLFTLFINKVTA